MQKIIHIDMDCFYAAIEMRDNPKLRERPIAVGGRKEQRGVIATANYPARRYGVRSAMPTAQAFKCCPSLLLLPGRMAYYRQESLKMQQILDRYSTKKEMLSLDEAYLDVSHSQLFAGSATLIAQAIRQDIEQELQLTASAGIASVKFLAKIASELNKPNGQYLIPPEQVDEFVAQLPLNKIPGVGRVTAAKLAQYGWHVGKDLQQVELAQLVKLFGKMGLVLWQRCRGIDPRPVQAQRLRKSVGVERTLTVDNYHWSACLIVMRQLYDELSQRLQHVSHDGRIARLGVKVRFSDFQLTSHEQQADYLTWSVFVQLLQDIWQHKRQQRGIRLLGLQVTLLDPLYQQQLAFAWPENEI